jgi:serine/threonine protein kinase/WD40 repeat protein
MQAAGASSSSAISKCPTDDQLKSLLHCDLRSGEAQLHIAHLRNCPKCQSKLEQFCDDPLVSEYVDSHRRSYSVIGSQRDRITADGSTEATDDIDIAYNQSAVAKLQERFTIRKRIGYGGFSVVYLAEDLLLHRQVALKIPHAARLINPEVMRRFQVEVQATATLHHPHIVPIFEAVKEKGLCYLIAEFCPGGTLAEWIAKHRIAAPRQAARIVLPLAEAVAYAHSRKIIHRDIKPSNVILDSRHTYAELPFCPRLTDFGIAKLLDSEGTHTASGLLIGTPRYMAPEQAKGVSDDIGPAVDLYALGVILYELCTGKLPIDGGDDAGTLGRLLSEVPAAPRKMVNDLPRDLEAVILKCIEKQPQDRYASVASLVDDLRRFLSGQPTLARPLPVPLKCFRWAKRNPVIAIGIAGVIVASAALIVGLFVHSATVEALNRQLKERINEVRSANQQAMHNERRAKETLYASDIRLSAQMIAEGEPREAHRLLTRHIPEDGQPDGRGSEWFFLKRKASPRPEIQVAFSDNFYEIALSPTGKELAIAGKQAVIRFCDPKTGVVSREIDTGQKEVNGLHFTEDGTQIVSTGDDGTLRIWNCESGELLQTIQAFEKLAFGVRFFDHDRRLVAGDASGSLSFFSVATGESQEVSSNPPAHVQAAAISPDSKSLAVADVDHGIRILDLNTDRWRTFDRSSSRIAELAFSPDGRLLAAVATSAPHQLCVWDVLSEQLVLHGEGPDGMCDLVFSPNSTQVLATDNHGSLRLWNLPSSILSQALTKPTKRSPDHVWYIDEEKPVAIFDRNGERLFTAGRRGNLRSWLMQPSVARFPSPAKLYCLTPLDETHWLTSTAEGIALQTSNSAASMHPPAYDAARHTIDPIAITPGPWRSIDAVPELGLTAAGFGDRDESGRIVIWDRTGGAGQVIFESERFCEIEGLQLSGDGKHLAATISYFAQKGDFSATEKYLVLHQIVPPKRLFEIPASSATRSVFTPDGGQLFYGIKKDLHAYDLKADRHQKLADEHGSTVNEVAISGDGCWLASTDGQREIKIWHRSNDWKLVSACSGHQQEVDGLAFSSDSRTLFSVSRDGTLRGWITSSGQPLGVLHRETGALRNIHALPSGQLIMQHGDHEILTLDFGSEAD